MNRTLLLVLVGLLLAAHSSPVAAQLKTWDQKHSIERIELTVVYFLPRDRQPLPDWKERVNYFCRRIEQFHEREFQGQSKLTATPRTEPLRSVKTTAQLRDGDADFIFFQTLGEADQQLRFGRGERQGFPILLVLSDINWRPLDDFYRVKPTEQGGWAFEGNYNQGEHFPGAEAGGARATYLADRGVGWGLVSADGWRVPYRGTDCVVYHEGCGHTVGLPHPRQGNNSVMSLGQYVGWISQSWLDDAQKKRLGWQPPEQPFDRSRDLFSTFTALVDPKEPQPNQPVSLQLTWPAGVSVKSCRVRLQTDLWGSWHDVTVSLPAAGQPPTAIPIGQFDRATPVSYRVDVTTTDGRNAELWGYFQVREKSSIFPTPRTPADPLDAQPIAKSNKSAKSKAVRPQDAVDLLSLVKPEQDQVAGTWQKQDNLLLAPKEFGARIELPYEPPEEYELTVIAEPLDEPNGLLLGQRLAGKRFVALLNYQAGEGPTASALENVDGKNVGANETTVRRDWLMKGRPSQIICTVKKNSVQVTCDGQLVIDWTGNAQQLSLSDYWKTPHDNVLMLGAYDCRYRFSRITLTPLSGTGKPVR